MGSELYLISYCGAPLDETSGFSEQRTRLIDGARGVYLFSEWGSGGDAVLEWHPAAPRVDILAEAGVI